MAGLLGVATAGVMPALALLPDRPAARAWSHSPPEPPLVHPAAPARWNHGSSASLGLLRRVTAREATRSQSALAACERRAGHRVSRYRRCAVTALERTSAFAAANSKMLSLLVSDALATHACRGRVLALSGSTGLLAQIARTTRMSGLDAPWPDVLAASRSIRGLAHETVRLAHWSRWATTCRARPAAPPPPDRLTA